MSDDRERRLRDALRGASLPDAPDTLRAMLAALPTEAGEAETPPRRSWRGALALVATTVAVTVLVVVVGLPALRPDPAATAAPSGPLTTEPLAAVEVLDAAALEAVILAVRAGDLAPRTVVTSAGVIPPGGPTRIDGDCDPGVPCTEAGVIEGLDPEIGRVAVADRERIKPLPLTATELRGPVALRIAASGSLELLGHVDVVDGATGAVDVAGLKTLEATAPDGRVVAVDGWLAGVNAPSCGPVFPEQPPAPFDCPGLRAFLADEPVRPATPEGGNGMRVSVPGTAVLVQYGAYQEFALDPAMDGPNDEPRHGLYLVRMVTADTEGCEGCRGWLVVGRLDPLPDADSDAPTPQADVPTDLVVVRSPAQIANLLARGRDQHLGTVVFVDGRVLANARACPLGATSCTRWVLAGTDEQVTMTELTAAQLAADAPFMLEGPLALRVLPDSLEYLGWLGSFAADGGFTTDVAAIEDLASMPRGPVTVAVEGWLVAGPLRHCLAQIGMEGLGDTAFVTCPPAWLTSDEVKATQLTDGGISDDESTPTIRVQYNAYSHYAPSPVSDGAAPAPQRGTYLVRLLRNPNVPDPEAARSWQIVARLDPPATASPNASPSPSPAATRTPPPTPAPTSAARPPTDLPLTVTERGEDVRVTVTLDRNPLPAGEITRAVIRVTNLGPTTLHWASDGCATPVLLHASVATPWRMGVEQSGNAQMFKRYALQTYFGDDLPLPSIQFLTRDELETGPRGCADLLMRNDIAPGETLRDVRFWDGAASWRWGPPPDGPVVIEGEFEWFWRGDPGDIPEWDSRKRIPVSLDAWIIGGSTADLLSPPEAVDAALANPEFVAFVESLDIGNGNEPFVRYRRELDAWEVGDISYADDRTWIRLVRLDARTGEVIAFEDRAQDPTLDGGP